MKILKFPLARAHRQTILMPHDATILTVQAQHDLVTLWASCSDGIPSRSRTFICAFTGADVPDNAAYLGTCQFHGGSTVVHVFEEV